MNAAKKGLGRGLSALFGDIEKKAESSQVQTNKISIADLKDVELPDNFTVGNNNDKNTRGNAIQNGITIRNKDLSKDNTIRELIVKNVCIYCSKTYIFVCLHAFCHLTHFLYSL